MKSNNRAYLCLILFLLLFSSLLHAASLGEATQLPVTGRFDRPVWAPDGSGIALSGEGFKGLYLSDISGNVRQVSDAPLSGWGFQWSPDGRNLAYRAKGEQGTALMLTGPDGREKVLAPQIDTKSPLKWDKNGLTYRSGDEMVTVDADGNVKRVSSLSGGQGLLAKMMNLSSLLVTGQITGASLTAFPVSAAVRSGHAKPLEGPAVDTESQIWITDENGDRKKLLDIEGVPGYGQPEKSPTGDKYAVYGFDGNLYVADANGGQPVNLGKGNNPQWSPDGQFIVYERSEDDGHRIISSDIWISSVDGKYQYQLTITSDIEQYPSWSPDGRSIAYVVDGVIYIAPVQM